MLLYSSEVRGGCRAGQKQVQLQVEGHVEVQDLVHVLVRQPLVGGEGLLPSRKNVHVPVAHP